MKYDFIPDSVSEHTNVYDVLKERGFIEQSTDEEKVRELLQNEKVKFYIGFDPTADCLHVGHFMQVIIMMYMQKFGHTPVVLLGGGTGFVGDPSGRTDMRQMMTAETIESNCEAFKKLFDRFLDFDEDWKYEGNNGVFEPGHENKEPEPGKAISVNNARWLLPLNYIDFIREIGSCFNVNTMLRAECFKQRMDREGGLTMFELNYMLMQSYDFLHLAREYGCKMQFGGNDQWSNIIGGVELNRRCDNRDVYGMTFTLLTTREGKKMGKTEKGAVWLDPEKTSPYEFFQYWRNIDDCEVQNCLKLLTGVPVKEIDAIDMGNASDVNKAKELLAYELTSLVHSKEDAEKAIATAKRLFSGEMDAEHMPATVVDATLVADGKASVLDLLVAAGLAPSKGEARRLVQQGGISVDGEKVTDVSAAVNAEALGKGIVIKKGKKVYHRITL